MAKTQLQLEKAFDRLRQAVQRLFGDRIGLLIFIFGILFFWIHWQVGLWINDNVTIVNTLAAIADGHLSIERAVVGPSSGKTPGTVVSGQSVYGRNYGQVFIALPILGMLLILTAVAPLGVLLPAGFSLMLLWGSTELARAIDDKWPVWVGVSLSSLLFVLNLTQVQSYPAPSVYVVAMQASTLLLAASIPVVVYRIVVEFYDLRVALFAAGVTILASPIAIWATRPKRHTLTALLVLLTMYCMIVSRRGETHRRRLIAHALAYGVVGVQAWAFAPEAIVLAGAIVVTDIFTLAEYNRQRLLAVAGVFCVSLVPAFVTNILISGHPLIPPQRLTPYFTTSENLLTSADGMTEQTTPVEPQLPEGEESNGAPPAGESSSSATAGESFQYLRAFVRTGISTYSQPRKFFDVFLWSSSGGETLRQNGLAPLRLSMLESMPLLGVLLALPVYVRQISLPRLSRGRGNPLWTADIFAVTYTVGLITIYISSLPTSASTTVRYLHPLYLLGIYGIVRLPLIRSTVTNHPMSIIMSYLVTVAIGGQLAVLALADLSLPLGTAIFGHSVLAIATAISLTVWVVIDRFTKVGQQLGAAVIGWTCGINSVFLLLSALEFFQYSTHWALPILGRVAAAINLVI